MTRISEDEPPDAELQQLVSHFLDRSLTEGERDRLEQRLREEPAAERYCAQAIRFDATLKETLDPRTLEWEETRRVIFDPREGSPGWSVQRQQTFRYGDGDAGRPSLRIGLAKRARKHRWVLGGIGLLAAASAGGLYYYRHQGSSYALRNGGFEAMDLSQSPTGVSRSVLYWQDYFSATGTEVCEIGRTTKGRFYAKSGRNAIRLQDGAFINQIILDKRGNALKAVPGLRVELSGWSYTEGPKEHNLRASLRFVASGYPDMIQYEAAHFTAPVAPGGWHPVKIELTVPADLVRTPSDFSSDKMPAPPQIDLAGKELTLSLDNRSLGAELYLDDLSVKIIRPGE